MIDALMDKPSNNLQKTKILVLTALLFAIAIVLSIVENSLPAVSTVPGLKLGLSNIAVMYALFFINKKQAYTIAVLKAIFVFITRGMVASILSLTGGILSISVMVLLIFMFKDKLSYLALSIFGAISHNIGQFIAVSFIYTSMYLWVYLPVLLIAGIIAGLATSTLLKLILPAFKKLANNKN